MLQKKQTMKNEAWIAALQNIWQAVPRKELDLLVEKTVTEIMQATKGRKAAYSWSGGKDSLVLERLCAMAGIEDCVLVRCDLEYPAFMDWVTFHKPSRLEIVNTGQDLYWLSKNQGILFPQDSAAAGKWFHIVQHRGQAKYFKSHKLDMLLLGRRRAEGNYIGAGGNTYTTASGVTRHSPIAYWRHEDVLAFIHYYDVKLPPIYGWHNGYLCGTHPWPARQWTGSIENGWKEVFDIDPYIVMGAAEYIESANVFLDGGRI